MVQKAWQQEDMILTYKCNTLEDTTYNYNNMKQIIPKV